MTKQVSDYGKSSDGSEGSASETDGGLKQAA